MIATPDHATAQAARTSPLPAGRPDEKPPASPAPRPSHPLPDAATLHIPQGPMWAHLLVLDMLKANLPLTALAEHLRIPFLTLVGYINSPEVQAEIDALEKLTQLRARLLGEIARPISLRKLLEVLERPAPAPGGCDPEADTRNLIRHAELIRRTATTIARESRFLSKPVDRASAGDASRQSGTSDDGSPSRQSGAAEPTPPAHDPTHAPTRDQDAVDPAPPSPAEPADDTSVRGARETAARTNTPAAPTAPEVPRRAAS